MASTHIEGWPSVEQAAGANDGDRRPEFAAQEHSMGVVPVGVDLIHEPGRGRGIELVALIVRLTPAGEVVGGEVRRGTPEASGRG